MKRKLVYWFIDICEIFEITEESGVIYLLLEYDNTRYKYNLPVKGTNARQIITESALSEEEKQKCISALDEPSLLIRKEWLYYSPLKA